MSEKRMSNSLIALIIVVALLIGTIGGGIAGGAVALLADDDSETTTQSRQPVTATDTAGTEPESVQTQLEPETATTETDTPDQLSGEDASTLTADIVERVNPAVVTVINVQEFSGFGQTGDQPAGTGTGFIISDDGYIVTNNHVVEGSDSLQVIYLDGTVVDARLIGADPVTDLALLQVDGEVPGTVTLGDSDQIRQGETVIAIGSALGDFTNTVTQGVVSGLSRQLSELDGLIQHDAPINPGNSGGPLLNLDGEVIGVNTAVVRQAGTGISAEGLGFSVPSNTVEVIIEDLMEDGVVRRAYIGVTFGMLTPQAASVEGIGIDHGAYVSEVVPGGPADQAGIQIGDVITMVDGQNIDQDNPLRTVLFQYAPGDTVSVEIFRTESGETLTLDVTLGERPANL
jgi:2-alkenal reductase